MTDLNDFFYTDGVDDVMAAYVNNLVAGNLRGELTNTQTLSGDLTLSDASFPMQYLTPTGANRNVFLPLGASTNHVFLFKNLSATLNLVVKNSTGSTTLFTLPPGGSMAVAPAGGVAWVPFSQWYNLPAVVDSTTPAASPATLDTFINMMANIVKTITGAANWHSAAISPFAIPIAANASAAVVATGVTTYLAPFGPGTFNATIAGTYWVVPRAGVIRNFRVRANSAHSAGGTFVMTVMKVAVAQSLEITMAASEAGGTKADTTNSFSVVAGDLVTFRFVNNGSGNGPQIVGVVCELCHQ